MIYCHCFSFFICFISHSITGVFISHICFENLAFFFLYHSDLNDIKFKLFQFCNLMHPLHQRFKFVIMFALYNTFSFLFVLCFVFLLFSVVCFHYIPSVIHFMVFLLNIWRIFIIIFSMHMQILCKSYANITIFIDFLLNILCIFFYFEICLSDISCFFFSYIFVAVYEIINEIFDVPATLIYYVIMRWDFRETWYSQNWVNSRGSGGKTTQNLSSKLE